MTYLAAPDGKVVHIARVGGFGNTRYIDGEEVRVLEALCPAFFPNPHLTPYFVERRRGRPVCKHCARMARRIALRLLTESEGDR